jgi:hypothetical protein
VGNPFGIKAATMEDGVKSLAAIDEKHGVVNGVFFRSSSTKV